MKKQVILILLFSTHLLISQNIVPNGNFELLKTTHFSYPAQFDFNSSTDELQFNIQKTVGYSGSYGVELKTVLTDEPKIAFIANGSPESEDPTKWNGGIPYSQTPTGLQDFYKYNVADGTDKGIVAVAFSKNRENIGTYFHYLDGSHAEYTPFSFSFEPALTEIPDSVFIAFISSDMLNNTAEAGSTLIIDNISFTSVSSQPELLNGDFELWTDDKLEQVSDWFGHDNKNLSKTTNLTTDAYEGSYAIVLRTLSDNYGGETRVFPDRALTGNWVNCESGPCQLTNGFSFTNRSDKLEFYYKYAPNGNDKAQVRLHLMKNDGNTENFTVFNDLPSTAEYAFISIPFEAPFEPNEAVIEFLSSSYENLSIENVGSELKVDAVTFFSNRTSVHNINTDSSVIFPNPVKNGFYLTNHSEIVKLSIYNLDGKLIYSINNPKNYIDLTLLNKGIYYAVMDELNTRKTEKFIVE